MADRVNALQKELTARSTPKPANAHFCRLISEQNKLSRAAGPDAKEVLKTTGVQLITCNTPTRRLTMYIDFFEMVDTDYDCKHIKEYVSKVWHVVRAILVNTYPRASLARNFSLYFLVQLSLEQYNF